jgi:hypothetical protein
VLYDYNKESIEPSSLRPTLVAAGA